MLHNLYEVDPWGDREQDNIEAKGLHPTHRECKKIKSASVL